MQKTNKLFILINWFIFICVMSFEIYISRYGSLFIDDINYGIIWEGENIWDLLLKNAGKLHGGGYFNLFLTKFFCWKLPEVLNIHPADFAVFPMSFIKGIITASLCYFIGKFIIVFSKNRILHPFYTVLTSLLYFCGLNYVCINNNVLNFFRYNLSLLVFCLFWLFILNNILKKKTKNTFWEITGITFCAAFLGTNLEICSFSSILFAFFIIMHNIICKIFNQVSYSATSSSEPSEYAPFKVATPKFRSRSLSRNLLGQFKNKQNSFNLSLKFYIPVFILISSCLWFVQTEGFKYIADKRGLNDINISFDLISEFLQIFFNLYVIDYLIYWLLFFLFTAFCLFLTFKKYNYKKVLIPFYMQLSITIIFLSLIFCGKTLYGSDKFWIEYGDVLFTFKIISLIPLAILIGLVQRYSKKIKIPIYSLFCILIVFLFLHINDNALITQEQTKKIHEMNYICDKLYQFYYLKNQTPVIPKEREDNYYGWSDYQGVTVTYLKRVYNQKINIENFKVNINKNAIEIFKQNGGKLTDEELKNIKFANLRNKNFVLGKEI